MRKKKILIVAIIAIIIMGVFLWLLCREVKGTTFVPYTWNEESTTGFWASETGQMVLDEIRKDRVYKK